MLAGCTTTILWWRTSCRRKPRFTRVQAQVPCRGLRLQNIGKNLFVSISCGCNAFVVGCVLGFLPTFFFPFLLHFSKTKIQSSIWNFLKPNDFKSAIPPPRRTGVQSSGCLCRKTVAGVSEWLASFCTGLGSTC